jgi:AAA15 family ATPase/GTPase
MSDLHLDSLEIKSFRCFEHLVIPKLGRVNLIVGKNSVGKTCLLEALLLYITKANFSIVQKLLIDRGELNLHFAKDNPIIFGKTIPFDSQFANPIIIQQTAKSLRHIFFNRKLLINETESSIKTNNSNLVFKLEAHTLTEASPEIIDAENPALLDEIISKDIHFDWYNTKIGSHIHNHEQIFPIALFPKDQLDIVVSSKLRESKTLFIPHGGLSKQEMESLWNRISLTDAENQVIHAINRVSNAVERVSFVGDSELDGAERYPVAKVKDGQEPVPLGQLGEGVSRALGISLALVNSNSGFLLIDEFETGLHHSVQTDIWRMIFETAKRLNIQVFATTHSWDCVEAFQQAAAEDQNEEAMLIRLQRKRDGTGIEAINYDERRLAVATRQNVEVR